MKPTVYLETTVVSYLVASPSRNALQAGRQRATGDWWAARDRFDVFVSTVVIEEASLGDPVAALARLELMRPLPLLTVRSGAASLARKLLRAGALPVKAELDAVHIAIAALSGMDYLLTWNLKHLANPAVRGKIERECRVAGLTPPLICTPETLLEM